MGYIPHRPIRYSAIGHILRSIQTERNGKVNSFREPVGAAGFCAIWQRNGEAGIRKKQHNCKSRICISQIAGNLDVWEICN